MAEKINVLVFPCGSENGIEIHTALKDAYNINLFGASGKEDHGRFVYRNYFGDMPYITDGKFIDTFKFFLNEHKIHIVFPTHDDIALFLAEHQSEIKSKVAVPGIEQARICRSKIATYDLFKNEDFCPVVYPNSRNITDFPIFAKPDKGQGGKGSFIITDGKKLKNISIGEDFVICEYLPGEELTVDCFTDSLGKLRFAGPRKRNRVFGGISVNSYTIPLTDEIQNIANVINKKIKMRGLWFFQVKQDKRGKYKLLEISVRTAGSMNLYRGLGVNFPLLTVYDLMDYEIEILKNDNYLELDRALFNRYRTDLEFEAVYIDFDDTIIKDNKVNCSVMLFLYNMKNAGKKIFLITKHTDIIDVTLEKYSIHPGLFDGIIRLKPEDEKYIHITAEKSIFIDNAYKERQKVKKELNIPVFDVDAIGTLIDWRE